MAVLADKNRASHPSQLAEWEGLTGADHQLLNAAVGDNQIFDVESQINIGMNGERGAAILACGGLVDPCVEKLTRIRDELLRHRPPSKPIPILRPRGGPAADVLIEGGVRILNGELIPSDAGIVGLCRARNGDRCNGKGNPYPNGPLDLRQWELRMREIYDIPNEVPFITPNPFAE